MSYYTNKGEQLMKQKLIDTNVIHTTVGTFRREIIVYELTGKGCEVSTSIFFN